MGMQRPSELGAPLLQVLLQHAGAFRSQRDVQISSLTGIENALAVQHRNAWPPADMLCGVGDGQKRYCNHLIAKVYDTCRQTIALPVIAKAYDTCRETTAPTGSSAMHHVPCLLSAFECSSTTPPGQVLL